MKKIIIFIFLVFFVSVLIFAAGTRPGIRPLSSVTTANTVTSVTKGNTVSVATKGNTATKRTLANGKTKKTEEIKSDLPKIPQEWGHLVKGEFIMDGAYLALYFEDGTGNIRVAIYSTDKKVKLFKLMVFPREIK